MYAHVGYYQIMMTGGGIVVNRVLNFVFEIIIVPIFCRNVVGIMV